jgi:hypothetical protein
MVRTALAIRIVTPLGEHIADLTPVSLNSFIPTSKIHRCVGVGLGVHDALNRAELDVL